MVSQENGNGADGSFRRQEIRFEEYWVWGESWLNMGRGVWDQAVFGDLDRKGQVGQAEIRMIQLHRLKCYSLWTLEFRKISTFSNYQGPVLRKSA